MLFFLVGDAAGREFVATLLKGLVSSYNLKSLDVIRRDGIPGPCRVTVSCPSGCRRSGRLISTIGEMAEDRNGELARGL